MTDLEEFGPYIAVERGKAVERMFEPDEPRAAAERAVLEALAAMPEQWLVDGARMTDVPAHWVCRAELARRAVKP